MNSDAIDNNSVPKNLLIRYCSEYQSFEVFFLRRWDKYLEASPLSLWNLSTLLFYGKMSSHKKEAFQVEKASDDYFFAISFLRLSPL